jgi:hypothetical protein
MGKLNDNVLVHGLRGKVGDLLVFRIVKGQTIVGKKPSTANRTYSQKQLDQREHFQEGVIYGKAVMVTPELKAMYETSIPEGKSVYHVALADFLRAPKIREVDVSKYTGEAGSLIRMRVVDDFLVKNVTVAIFNSDGSLVEEGEAFKMANNLDWMYTATSSNGSLEGDKIVITATDLPGHASKSETEL